MPITFVDRKGELEFMESLWKRENSFLPPIYGRRRVGKTRLVKEFIRGKPSIYYLARSSTYRDNLLEFSRAVLEAYPSPYLSPPPRSQILPTFSDTCARRGGSSSWLLMSSPI
ncbi:ATP-binding protein [Thermococcus sp. JCM 11816]|uniref:ATP-binding protein n=1 Tax=Thermococcus sp. (strain JCM 11816 / KS-1) TaxID=1295125 RepID=UPI000A9C57D8